MKIRIDRDRLSDFESASSLEWLEANGLGGWASSTVSGAHTRRYHGLLVAAVHPPLGRTVLLSKLEETLEIDGNRSEIGCNLFPGAISPQGYRQLVEFEKDLFPTFVYQVGDCRLRKTVAALHGENTTLVLYQVLQAPRQFDLELRPFVASRDYHSLASANQAIGHQVEFDQETLRVRAYPDSPTVYIRVPESDFRRGPDWYYHFEYSVEQRRGLDYQEDLWTPGILRVSGLRRGVRLGVLISTEPAEDRDALALFEAERRRRQALLSGLPKGDSLGRRLALAADQFVVPRDKDRRTVIAGYHWFGDWGRDTMIALDGLCLATGRLDDAKRILQAFAQSADEGMLPNRFPDSGEQPEYNTVDATLWFFVAAYRYLEAGGDKDFVGAEILPVLRSIVDWHRKGTRYRIHQAEDGLLWAGEPGVQLTWMDAKVGDWVVTPRHGKPVEINALWYNALEILSRLEEKLGDPAQAQKLADQAKAVLDRFNSSYWNEDLGGLFDNLTENGADASIRPNQIFALSLPFPLLSGERARRVLKLVEDRLFTPVGLRSLSQDHQDYRPRYEGGVLSRDGAYHQGTVWSWLMGPFLTALVRYREDGRQRAREILDAFAPHLTEAGLGTVSEIFDGDPPHEPRGCIAQAWGVAELLRVHLSLKGSPRSEIA